MRGRPLLGIAGRPEGLTPSLGGHGTRAGPYYTSLGTPPAGLIKLQSSRSDLYGLFSAGEMHVDICLIVS